MKRGTEPFAVYFNIHRRELVVIDGGGLEMHKDFLPEASLSLADANLDDFGWGRTGDWHDHSLGEWCQTADAARRASALGYPPDTCRIIYNHGDKQRVCARQDGHLGGHSPRDSERFPGYQERDSQEPL